VRLFLGFLVLTKAWGWQTDSPPRGATVQDFTHESQVLAGAREYRAILPPAYRNSQKRYPVIYWFHGYEQANEEREREISEYVAAHDAIVVEAGPVETTGEYPLYFPELVDTVDKTLRTVADRDHRAVTGVAMGGFIAFFMAGKYPDLVASASNFMGAPESTIGPKGFDVEYRHDDFFANYGSVRTRLVTGSRDPMRFYHQRMNSVWLFVQPHHDTDGFDSDHADHVIAKTLDFHMRAFADPLPKPIEFSHADPYPNFSVWGWEVASDRRSPGFTILENVSAKGFRSTVREWVPGGSAIPSVKLSIASARLYAPGSAQTVTYIRLRDGNVRRATQKADTQGRLNFELDGDAYEVGVSAEPLIAVTGYVIADAAWATAGLPVKLRVRFWNKGAARSATSIIQWQSPNPGVKFDAPSSRLYGLGPGESVEIPLTFTVTDPERVLAQIAAVDGTKRMVFDVPLFPPAQTPKAFQIADGTTVHLFQNATQEAEVTLGEGNQDGHAAPGESFGVLIPDGESLRAAEVFTNDACVDLGTRASDSWAAYDHAGASIKYSLPAIRPECPPGHVVRMLARVVKPGYEVQYFAVELPVWYRKGEEPK
jgi:hypothetical protein